MAINWQWPSAVIFCTVTIVLGGLIYTGKLPADLLGVLIAWLVPSPLSAKAKPEAVAK